MLGRRRFLVLGLGGGAATAVFLPGRSTIAADTTTVWRLSANWGYPVPPYGRTRCRCNACHAHAANKLFATQAAATAGRIHPCCACQPIGVELLPADVTALFPGSVTTIDLRHGDHRALFTAAVARALAPPPTSTTPTAPTTTTPTAPSTTTDTAPTTSTGPSIEAGASPGVASPGVASPGVASPGVASPGVVASPESAAAPTANTLPATGVDVGVTVLAATAVLGLGVAAVAAAKSA